MVKSGGISRMTMIMIAVVVIMGIALYGSFQVAFEDLPFRLFDALVIITAFKFLEDLVGIDID